MNQQAKETLVDNDTTTREHDRLRKLVTVRLAFEVATRRIEMPVDAESFERAFRQELERRVEAARKKGETT